MSLLKPRGFEAAAAIASRSYSIPPTDEPFDLADEVLDEPGRLDMSDVERMRGDRALRWSRSRSIERVRRVVPCPDEPALLGASDEVRESGRSGEAAGAGDAVLTDPAGDSAKPEPFLTQAGVAAFTRCRRCNS